MSPQDDGLFWIAVTILAARAALEIFRAGRCIGRLTARTLRAAHRVLGTRLAQARVNLDSNGPAPPAPRTNYLETLSAEEMDQFLG